MTWPYKCETLSKFFLLNQDSKLMDLSETEVMKGRHKGWTLTGKPRAPVSPVSPIFPCEHTVTAMSSWECAETPMVLWPGEDAVAWALCRCGDPCGDCYHARFGRHWLSQRTYLQPIWPQLAWLPWPALQGKKDNDSLEGTQIVGNALMSEPIRSCIFVHQISPPVLCRF